MSSTPNPNKSVYLQSALWYWIIIILAMATSMAVLIPDNLYPLVYLRYMLGFILLLFLPGYSFLRLLFVLRTESEAIGLVENFALSVGLSLTFLSLLGLILNYSPFGIRLIPVTFCLTGMTIVFALIALIGEHEKTKNKLKLS